MVDDIQLELQLKIEALERKNRLLEEALHQAERLRRMFDRTAQELKATKLLLMRHSAELAESESRFRNAFQYSAIGMALVGLDGHWLKINNSLCRIVGYSEQELLSKTFQDITHPDDLQSDLYFVAQLLSGALDHYQMEKRYFHKDGHVVWIRLSVSLIRDAQNKPIHFVSQIEDITENKQAEQELLQSEADIRALVENSPIAMIVDVGVNKDEKIMLMNHKFTELFGYTREEVPDVRHWWPLAYPDEEYREKLMAEWIVRTENAIQSHSAIEPMEVTATCKDGSSRYIRISLASIGRRNIVTFEDLTERRQAEEKVLKLNEELETKIQERTSQLMVAQEELVRREKLAVLGLVAGSVGHELRNPLGVMSNAVYFLQTVLSDADDSVKEYLNIINNEIAASERIVSDLLDSVRTQPPHPEIVGVQELLANTLDKCAVPAFVTVKLNIPETLSKLRVDPLQIHQVFRNLISNSVEAMPKGGSLQISAVENKQDKNIEISVKDSGSGMTSEQLGRLFQPLFTTKTRGIGLGLMVVKNLTQANGGTVKVASEAGKGSVFTVTLPSGA